MSQTDIEQGHIRDALIFELSKCEVEDVRIRIVAHLLHIDKDLAAEVAQGLGLASMPQPAPTLGTVRTDLQPSDALSILKNGPLSFAGRTVGVLASDGVDAALMKGLASAIKMAGAKMKIVAPAIGGVVDSDGTLHPADEKIGGGPSVLFDAVAILLGAETAAAVARNPSAQDFLRDAHAHCKFIALDQASELAKACGLSGKGDDGYYTLKSSDDISAFVEACADLRFWNREATLAD